MRLLNNRQPRGFNLVTPTLKGRGYIGGWKAPSLSLRAPSLSLRGPSMSLRAKRSNLIASPNHHESATGLAPLAMTFLHLSLRAPSPSLRAKRGNPTPSPHHRDCHGTACLAMTEESGIASSLPLLAMTHIQGLHA